MKTYLTLQCLKWWIDWLLQLHKPVIIHPNYHGEIDIAGVELQVDMHVHQGLCLGVVVMANGAGRLIKQKRY
jgi:hypothetical protein